MLVPVYSTTLHILKNDVESSKCSSCICMWSVYKIDSDYVVKGLVEIVCEVPKILNFIFESCIDAT